MNIANIVVIIFLTYYTNYIVQLAKRKNRIVIKESNIKLDEIRSKPFKTLEEQKEFLNLKYPKKKKSKWSWKRLPAKILSIVFHIAIFIIIFRSIMWVFEYFGIVLQLWQAILFVMIAPILINIVLERFHLEKTDLRAYLGWKRKRKE